MSLDIIALSSTLALLVLNFGFILYMGTNQFSVVRVNAKDLDRIATERILRRNLGLSDAR